MDRYWMSGFVATAVNKTVSAQSGLGDAPEVKHS